MASIDGSRSIQGTSDEFQTNICGPCMKTDNVERGASHYCNECSDWLCNHCKDFHRKIPALTNHAIIPESQVPAITSRRGRPAIVIYCSCNKNQEVKHYCDDHKDTLCDSCKHSKHYKCKVSRLQDKSSSYTRSRIDVIIAKTEKLKADYEELEKTRHDDVKNLQQSVEQCQKEIKAFRKEMDTFLDGLEKTTMTLLKSLQNEAQTSIHQHISTLTATKKLVESDYKLLEDAKNDGGKTLMFAADIQVSKGLQDYRDRLCDISNDAIRTEITFERNKRLVDLQTEIDALGSLHMNSVRNTQGVQSRSKKLSDCKIQSQKQVNVKMSDDRNTPWITGTVVMATDELVFCDRYNNKLKLLDSSGALKGSLKLNAQTWDVSVVDAKTVIVTLPRNQQLQYIDVFPRLTLGRVLKLNKKCWGVHVTGDWIFTTCHNNPGEGEVRILDLDGNLLQQLGINQDGSFMFTQPYYITVSPSEKKIFVSDYGKDTVTCMTMDNRVIYQYRDNGMNFLSGLYCDGGDNILVCGRGTNNIQVITAEGKKHCDLVSSTDGLKAPLSISYRESDDTLIVGCYHSNNVILYKLGK